MPLNIVENEPWYKNGLHFSCTQCGKCCTGAPGYVWVSPDEIKGMAAFLDMSVEDFSKKYIRQVGEKYSLTENEQDNFSCVFLKEKKCKVYGARPKQCRTYPFWPHVLMSRQSWEKAAQECEGIGDTSGFVPFNEIQKKLL